jgi:hypothetical protein
MLEVNSHGEPQPQDQPRRGLVKFDFARNVDAGNHFELFLVSAVAAILVIRLYLELTGYPQMGGHGLHIAHMLWGGLLMLAANVLLLGFLGKRVKRTAAVVGGIGFGAFIDELGKFITADNDYFYAPTVGLIYVIFVALFLLFRQIERNRALSREENLVNAADMIKEVILDGAQSDEIARSLTLLERSGARGPLSASIQEAVLSAGRAEPYPPSIPARLTAAGRRAYERLVRWRWFQRAILLLFALEAGTALVLATLVLLGWSVMGFGAEEKRSFATLGLFTGAVLSAALAAVGMVRLVRSALAAYRWFKRSVLVSIFFVQVFLFFEAQLAALGGLAFSLALLSGLNEMLSAEHARDKATHANVPVGKS